LRQKIALNDRAIEWALLLGSMLAAGCATQRYHPAPIAAEQTAAAFTARRLDDSGLRAFAEPVYGPADWPAAFASMELAEPMRSQREDRR